MGMFDTIQCSDAMPFNDDMAALGLNVRDWSFQTKDLDNCMSEYVLQDGVLYQKKYKETKWIEPGAGSTVAFGDARFNNNFGHMKYTGEYLEDTKYHGVLNMHNYRQNVMGWDCWIEYAVTFTDGKVTNTVLTKFIKEDSAPRIQRHKELWDRIEAQEAKWYNKYIFYTRGWHKLTFLKRRAINLLITWLTYLNNFNLRFL